VYLIQQRGVMSKHIIVISCVFAFLVCFPGSKKASEMNVAIIHFPPYYICDGSKPVGGIYVDLLRVVLDTSGIKHKLECFPPQRYYYNISEGNSPLTINIKGSKELEGKVIYSSLALPGLELRAYKANNSDESISKKEQFIGKKIIVVRGYNYGGLLKYLEQPENKIDLVIAPSHLAGFKMLKAKRGEALLNYRHSAEDVSKETNIENIEYGVLYKLDGYFILNQNYPDAEQVMRKIETAYLSLK